MAELIANSGMVPKGYEGNAGAVLVAVQMGAELGLSPMSAIQNIAVINGRPSLWGDAGLALVCTHRDFVDIIEELSSTKEEAVATCTITRKGRTPTVRTFSFTDAKKAGLAGKQGPWTQYPKRMLQMRARWFAMRDAFPDALRGVASAEESQDIDMGPAPYAEAAPAEGKRSFLPSKKSAPVSEPMPEAPAQPPPIPESVRSEAEEPDHDADGVVVEKDGAQERLGF